MKQIRFDPELDELMKHVGHITLVTRTGERITMQQIYDEVKRLRSEHETARESEMLNDREDSHPPAKRFDW